MIRLVFLTVLLLVSIGAPKAADADLLVINLCAQHPLQPEKDICEPRYSQTYADEALCERAADRDGDGFADPFWLDVLHRLGDTDGDDLAEPGLWLVLYCPLRAYPVIPEVP